MVARFNTCDKRRLRDVLARAASDDAESELALHLETCESCRRDLESLAGSDGWWSDVRSFLSSAEWASGDPSADADGAGSVGAIPIPSDPFDPHRLETWRKQLGFLAPSETPGSLGRLGSYEITDFVGRGGMGIVLKAFDPALNRHVAIKVLAAEWAHNATARRRFAREAQAAAAVVHDHVVPIHSVDASGEVPYLVMAYIPGRSLQERLDRTGPLELKEILRIGSQAASGLAAAHAQGLVHRDIKPANILLEDGLERVRITDFGLARAVDDVSQTQSGILAGTPQYMSPEQASGEAVDHRTDLFSLGSVLYAMCSGRSPFRAESPMAVLRRICDRPARPVREINSEIPEWLAEIIDKLHAKDPAGRFQTANELADLLERHLAHLQQPGTSPRPERLAPARTAAPDARRNKKRVAIAAGAVLGLLVLAAITFHERRPRELSSEEQDLVSSEFLDHGLWSPLGDDGAAPTDAVEAKSSVPPSASRKPNDLQSVEAEVQQLQAHLLELEAALHPREDEPVIWPKDDAVLAIEQCLRRLEFEMRQPADRAVNGK
ncbi:MAG TPA: serine/threonine-protein kinase [Planctomycetaceae bacterium]|nr:serine/threonine-protein kinase [Planctomycetaceae bacterium]